jgi:hypothetical protein
MSHEIETERRFLLKTFPADLETHKKVFLEDTKIITREPHPHLRLRREDKKMVLTKKYKTSDKAGLVQMVEEHIVLNESEYNSVKKPESTVLSKW